jgi:hypothetical protein
MFGYSREGYISVVHILRSIINDYVYANDFSDKVLWFKIDMEDERQPEDIPLHTVQPLYINTEL